MVVVVVDIMTMKMTGGTAGSVGILGGQGQGLNLVRISSAPHSSLKKNILSDNAMSSMVAAFIRRDTVKERDAWCK